MKDEKKEPITEEAAETAAEAAEEKAEPTPEERIHGEDSLRSLIRDGSTVGFLFDGMRKNELFRTVIYDGELPRKTFSMGHAPDKRYYLECRKIK